MIVAALVIKNYIDWFENNALFSNDPHYKYCGVIKSSGDMSAIIIITIYKIALSYYLVMQKI